MSFADQSALAANSWFTARLTACATEQAGVFINDARVEYVSLARQVLADPVAATWFSWPVATAPGLGDTYAGGGQEAIADGDILAAVQAAWPTISFIHPED